MRRLDGLIDAIHHRLADVVIEQLPYGEFIERYDHARALFYLDPPYFQSEDDYGKGAFTRADFGRLARQLGGLKGGFILSINDAPEIRRIFDGLAIEEVRLTYTISRGEGSAAAELLISDGAVEGEGRLF